MELILPSITHKQKALEYIQEYLDIGDRHIHGSGGLIVIPNYERWLEYVTVMNSDTPPEGLVRATTYFAVVDKKIIGTIQIRHTLSDELLCSGGHIGYSVLPSERMKGYATRMLAAALDICRQLGISKVLITCDKYNIASAATIKRNGGVFENELIEPDGNIVGRYWITL
ncbi:MAG: GNAT family N-acetyltransferase [Oscillospiraceae bacterium]|nr:GNAT family N-acetyltransferase [Oscillospiraceae bacterium]